MQSLVLVARSQARRRVRGLRALTLIVGIAAGISASLIAGSRRFSTVVGRYFAAGIPFSLGVYAPDGPLTKQQVEALPGVIRAEPESYVVLMRAAPVTGTSRRCCASNSARYSSPRMRPMSYSTRSSRSPASMVPKRNGCAASTHDGNVASKLHGAGWQNCTTE